MPSPAPPGPTRPPGPPRSTGSTDSPARTAAAALLLAALGLAVTWGVTELLDATASAQAVRDPRPGPARATLAVLVGLGVVAALVRWGRRVAAVDAVVVAVLGLTGTAVAGTGLVLLHGTAWGFGGLYSDAGFRTEMVTRYTDSAALADYGYRGLPAYYPPLLPWLQGRTAALLGAPGWTVLKPTQLVVCLVLPVAAWLLWRRVLPGRTAAWVAALAVLTVPLPHKPDEWLVLVLLVPWWLEVCRGVRAPGRARWGPVVHGVVLGVLLLCHTYFFVPLALATLVGAALDLARRRRLHPRPARFALTCLVGLAVASPSWWALVWARWHGVPTDDLQRRWSPPGFEVPPLPLPVDGLGVLHLVGLVGLVWAARRREVARGLLLVLLSAYAVVVGGQLLQPLGVALLPEKASELVELALSVGGALAVLDLVRWVGRRQSRRLVRLATPAAALVLALVAAVPTLSHALGVRASAAQTMRYPGGGFPAGGSTPGKPVWHPWGVEPGAGGPSVRQVADAWRRLGGGSLDDRVVLLSARADVAATTPVHLFLPWKSIYSHPAGRFAARLAVVRALGRCTTPACTVPLLRRNGLDEVDGLVLNRGPTGWYLTTTVDRFPDGWVKVRTTVDPRALRGPQLAHVELPGAVVVRFRG